jgi:hypothetical protein
MRFELRELRDGDVAVLFEQWDAARSMCIGTIGSWGDPDEREIT